MQITTQLFIDCEEQAFHGVISKKDYKSNCGRRKNTYPLTDSSQYHYPNFRGNISKEQKKTLEFKRLEFKSCSATHYFHVENH